jgi:hypothetical protein
MQDHHDGAAANGAALRRCEAQGETLLRAEIGVWREMLEVADCTVPAESVERMQQALALAECRLLQLFGERSAQAASSSCPESTSPALSRSLH